MPPYMGSSWSRDWTCFSCKADSLPLSHQGSPYIHIRIIYFILKYLVFKTCLSHSVIEITMLTQWVSSPKLQTESQERVSLPSPPPDPIHWTLLLPVKWTYTYGFKVHSYLWGCKISWDVYRFQYILPFSFLILHTTLWLDYVFLKETAGSYLYSTFNV